jgi:hypothetical protein
MSRAAQRRQADFLPIDTQERVWIHEWLAGHPAGAIQVGLDRERSFDPQPTVLHRGRHGAARELCTKRRERRVVAVCPHFDVGGQEGGSRGGVVRVDERESLGRILTTVGMDSHARMPRDRRHPRSVDHPDRRTPR